jgi:hypothetical protein
MSITRLGNLTEATTLDSNDKFITVDDTDTTTKAVIASVLANDLENSSGSYFPSIFYTLLIQQRSSLDTDITNRVTVFMTSSSTSQQNVKISLDTNNSYIRTTNASNVQQTAYDINTNNKIFIWRFMSIGSGYTLGVEGSTTFTDGSTSNITGFTPYDGFIVYLDHANNKVHVISKVITP